MVVLELDHYFIDFFGLFFEVFLCHGSEVFSSIVDLDFFDVFIGHVFANFMKVFPIC